MAAPLAVVEYPWTWIRFNGNKKKKMPIVAYRNRVSRFAPLKLRDLNRLSGSMGAVELASTNTNAARQAQPTSRLPNTRGFFQPRFTDSRKPYTTPANPPVAR